MISREGQSPGTAHTRRKPKVQNRIASERDYTYLAVDTGDIHKKFKSYIKKGDLFNHYRQWLLQKINEGGITVG